MRNIIIPVLLLLISSCSFGQSDIDYDFMNSALKQVSKYDNGYFQLQNQSYPCNLPDHHFEVYIKELKGKIDTATLKEIIHNSHSDPGKDYEFEMKFIDKEIGVHLITPSGIDSLQMNDSYLLPLNKQLFYISSIPVFDNKKTYAVIDFGGGTRRLAMTGQKYLFKKTPNGWKLIATFDGWAK